MKSLFILILAFVPKEVRCHCPHLMGMAKKEEVSGPSPPSSLPENDKGWDYDPSGAPGAVPNEHYIQTIFVHRSQSEPEKDYATLVLSKLGELRDRLRQQARVTVDVEVISCVEDSEHYRCADFQRDRSYHYLIVEESSKGSSVYSLERQLNEKSPGSTEMALLDALSRHSPQPLTIYASEEAEHKVGFVRQLSTEELQTVAKPPPFDVEHFSPIELNLIDTDLLELRAGENLVNVDHNLHIFTSKTEFDSALSTNKHLFVLFWSHVHIVSLHAFNLWARTSKLAKIEKDMLLAHVECHHHAEFCDGLARKDFYSIVYYRDGQNVGSTYHLRDELFYTQWIYLMISGPFIELKTEEEIKSAKKGLMFGSSPHPVIIGTFPDQECAEFQHFSIAADRLHGRYHMTVIIKPGATATVSAYRPNEKRRRIDYEGKFDPASLVAFISVASFPSVIDISSGFTTNLLFRQPRLVAILVASSSFSNSSYISLAARKEARKSLIFTLMNRDHELAEDVLKQFNLKSQDQPQVIVLDKASAGDVLTAPDCPKTLV
ncbi:hypothetical protein KIN20_015279 [Parelaphostrongylus tenuis]|uniref:Uncharacterized protein n=1 Tax=Parelaphostrongylus tenuis TaxID=148309 RepID=A0AAD5MJA6_PARTN|nr:hypothetical protein KIN20_015279 [Parelaphostrongylus tenuis]